MNLLWLLLIVPICLLFGYVIGFYTGVGFVKRKLDESKNKEMIEWLEDKMRGL